MKTIQGIKDYDKIDILELCPSAQCKATVQYRYHLSWAVLQRQRERDKISDLGALCSRQ